MSYFNHFTANLYKRQIIGVQIPHPLALYRIISSNQSRTNGPIIAHLTIAQVMPRYNHNNEKQEALL